MNRKDVATLMALYNLAAARTHQLEGDQYKECINVIKESYKIISGLAIEGNEAQQGGNL